MKKMLSKIIYYIFGYTQKKPPKMNNSEIENKIIGAYQNSIYIYGEQPKEFLNKLTFLKRMFMSF